MKFKKPTTNGNGDTTQTVLTTLSEEDSRLLSSLAQAIEFMKQGFQLASTNFQMAYEQVCRRAHKDPTKYDVIPTPGMAGRVSLIERSITAAVSGDAEQVPAPVGEVAEVGNG